MLFRCGSSCFLVVVDLDAVVRSGILQPLCAVLHAYCPPPPSLEPSERLPRRPLPPVLFCPFGMELLLGIHSIVQSSPYVVTVSIARAPLVAVDCLLSTGPLSTHQALSIE